MGVDRSKYDEIWVEAEDGQATMNEFYVSTDSRE